MKKSESTQNIEYPEICLAIDNCFASKRFTEPEEWLEICKSLDIGYVEASADTECDPLYMGRDYLRRWADKVKSASEKTGVSICNFYSGHGTYSTLGLAHTDPHVRERILNEWIKPMIVTAADLGAGLGFYCHAFADRVLQDPALYKEYQNRLISDLAEAALFSQPAGCKPLGIEQMYSPHQIPWTIKGTKDLLSRVYQESSVPFYTTIDTGHQSGQGNFLKPVKEDIIRSLEDHNKNIKTFIPWLGPADAYHLFESSVSLFPDRYPVVADLILKMDEKFPHLFAEPDDGSPYTWLEELGCYSPIIHLQQTDGTFSQHLPFTQKYNKNGIIEGKKVLESLKQSYDRNSTPEIPVVNRIYMTIEVFASTGSINYQIHKELEETVRYWRQFIPEDGMDLGEIVTNLN